MIHVRNLTKYYGDYPAVRDVSFDVAKGQIVGFLGPNGAGKSTTMRILAGFQTATSGKVSIDGFDVFWQPVEVRRRIGYMPENCPLYHDMRVTEYLRYRAGIKGLHGSQARQRVGYVVNRCWLGDVRRQLIGTLSKGYRQRVGLADTLLADPAVLILDEPTAGLDPTQIREARNLIRELGEQHTIILSTHILPEVEMTCNHVIIIHRGRVAAAGSLSDLEQRAKKKAAIVAEFVGPVDAVPLRQLEGAGQVDCQAHDGITRVRITTAHPEALSTRLYNLAASHHWKLRALQPQRQTLEDLFVRIVERDEAPAAEALPA